MQWLIRKTSFNCWSNQKEILRSFPQFIGHFHGNKYKPDIHLLAIEFFFVAYIQAKKYRANIVFIRPTIWVENMKSYTFTTIMSETWTNQMKKVMVTDVQEA